MELDSAVDKIIKNLIALIARAIVNNFLQIQYQIVIIDINDINSCMNKLDLRNLAVFIIMIFLTLAFD